MLIDTIHIKGFRCFKDAIIHFTDKNLILGANDIGKSNLIYALRLLFDKSLSYRDLELTSNDYYAYEETNEIMITVKVSNISEDCLVAGFKENIQNGTTYIRYSNRKDGIHVISTGPTIDTLEEATSRFYLRFLNMEVVNSSRNLKQFIKREKNNLIDFTKGKRSDQIVNQDNSLIEDIDNNLISINAKIDDISYIKKSLDSINTEMETLSVNNQNKKLRFSSISSDAEQLIDNVELIYETDDKKLTLGGDGRNNQIYLSTWISKQKELADDKSITFYALEEPEAHLHPQQQVRLARHIFDNLDQQILITSHSPSIANEINPGNIIRLYSSDSKSSIAANEGINEELINFFNDFAHRRNLINSQLYFLNSVLLVEGVSEVIFYKTLAKSKSIDLNQYNTEILSVEGVGFEPYAQICLSLKIPFSIRTDNDLNKIQNKTGMLRFSGINRLINLLNNLNYSIDFLPYSPIDYETIKKDISFKEGKKPSTLSNSMPIPEFINKLSKHNLYLATEDLEKDIIDSPLFSSLKEFYNETDRDIIYEKMCKKKGENMFNFSQSYFSEFEKIPDTSILFAPLLSILDLSIGETNE